MKNRNYILNDNILSYKKSNLKILDTNEFLIIKSQFNLFDKGHLYIVLFSILSLSFVFIGFIYGNNWLSILLVSLFGGTIFLMLLYLIVCQILSFVKITNDKIIFRNGLIKRELPIESNMQVFIREDLEYFKIKYSKAHYKSFDFFLKHDKVDYMLASFKVNDKYSLEASEFANKLLRLLKSKIK